MALNLMILTSFFAIEPKDITGGVNHRYVGLYGSLVKTLLKSSPKSKVSWYSHLDQHLRVFGSKENSVVRKYRMGMLKAVLRSILITVKGRGSLTVIIAYPYGIPKVKAIFSYVFSLLILRSFGINRIKVIVDDFDPPVENCYAFSETRPPILWVIYARTLDMLTLKLASSIITLSNSLKEYIARTYRIRKDKIFVVPTGCLVSLISYVPPRSLDPLTILYSGSLLKAKSIDKLISAVNNVRERGLKVSLVLAGDLIDISLPEWVIHKKLEGWTFYVKSSLETSDICVIPYPNKPFMSMTLLAKIDYMGAGKPIIVTNLKETGDVINRFNCGFVAKDWKEFEQYIERLYQDRELAKELGRNGRKAAETYFNYELLAETLLNRLVKM